MKRAIMILTIFQAINIAYSQSQLENSYFAAWQDIPSTTAPAGIYQEPVGNTWATSNEASMTFLASPSVKKTTDSYKGEYAALIETIQLGTTKGSGTLFTGKFKLNIANPLSSTQFGIPFTDRPVYLKGFYKYIPVANDSCRIASWLTKWNSVKKSRDTIAYATISRAQSILAVNIYTEFDIFYKYRSASSPDSITVIFASSADGANYNAAVGTKLYIDEISMEYYPLAIQNVEGLRNILVYPNPVSDYLIIESSKSVKDSKINIYSANGSLIKSKLLENDIERIQIFEMPKGLYFYEIIKPGSMIEKGKFLKN